MTTETQTIEQRLLALAEKVLDPESHADPRMCQPITPCPSWDDLLRAAGPEIIARLARIVGAARAVKTEAYSGMQPGEEPQWFTPAEQAVIDALNALDSPAAQRSGGRRGE